MYQHTRGFTLAEAVIAITISVVTLGLGLPALQTLNQHQQLKATSNLLMSSLVLARNESIMRNKPVLVDNTDEDWTSGWTIYVDANNNAMLDPSEVILAIMPPPPRGISIKGNIPVRRYIRYTSSGRTKIQSGGFQAGTLTLCHSLGNQAVRQLIISPSGRPRMSQKGSGTC